MAGESSHIVKKRAGAARAPRLHEVRQRAKPEAPKAAAPKRSLATRLAAEVDSLRADLAAARARVAELETRVDEDPLTGLRNRRGFERALEQALAYVRRYGATAALLYADLDRFKPVNDRHGHAAGDWVLGRVARLVGGHVRASDVVGRIGGDEFGIVLWNVGADQAADKARSLEAVVEGEAFDYKKKPVSLGLSVGTTMLTPNDTVEIALGRADEAMYARKRQRKAQAVD